MTSIVKMNISSHRIKIMQGSQKVAEVFFSFMDMVRVSGKNCCLHLGEMLYKRSEGKIRRFSSLGAPSLKINSPNNSWIFMH